MVDSFCVFELALPDEFKGLLHGCVVVDRSIDVIAVSLDLASESCEPCACILWVAHALLPLASILRGFDSLLASIDARALPALPQSFFARPAEVVAPELIGCLLVKRQANGELLWGVIVETEAYSQEEPACHGYRRRSPSNETLFGEPGRFYVYVSYGIHHCVKRARLSVTSGWA